MAGHAPYIAKIVKPMAYRGLTSNFASHLAMKTRLIPTTLFTSLLVFKKLSMLVAFPMTTSLSREQKGEEVSRFVPTWALVVTTILYQQHNGYVKILTNETDCFSSIASQKKISEQLSLKNEFQAGREHDTSERIFTVYPLALFGVSEIGGNA